METENLAAREAGFSVYVNGDASRPPATSTRRTNRSDGKPRRNWVKESLDLKADTGETLHVTARKMCTSPVMPERTDERTGAAVLDLAESQASAASWASVRAAPPLRSGIPPLQLEVLQGLDDDQDSVLDGAALEQLPVVDEIWHRCNAMSETAQLYVLGIARAMEVAHTRLLQNDLEGNRMSAEFFRDIETLLHNAKVFATDNDDPGAEHGHEAPHREEGRRITVRLLSSYGQHNSFGLSKIIMFDHSGRPLCINPVDIVVSGADSHGVHVLFDVEEEGPGWIAVGQADHSVEISIDLPATFPIDTMRIWNYNKSFTASDKCTKDVEVLVDGLRVWRGNLLRAVGNENFDLSTLVDLTARPDPGVVLPQRIKTPPTLPVERERDLPSPSQRPLSAGHDSTGGAGASPRATTTPNMNASLLESWSRLSHFDAHHSGRLDHGRDLTRGGRVSSPSAPAPAAPEMPQGQDPSRSLKDGDLADVEQELLELLNSSSDGHARPEDGPTARAPRVSEGPVRAGGAVGAADDPAKGAAVGDAVDRGGFGPGVEGSDTGVGVGGAVDTVDAVVPTLPGGMHLTVEVLSTWGDEHYVALTGIDVFDQSGALISLTDVNNQVVVETNVSSKGVDNDPRVPANLFDGVNRTSNDLHAWLAPYVPGAVVRIHVTFDAPVVIAMIRFWNYNGDRAHTARGCRRVHLSLDGASLLNVEVRRATGALPRLEDAECVLFTTEEEILSKIERNDHDLPAPEPHCSALMTSFSRPSTSVSTRDSDAASKARTERDDAGSTAVASSKVHQDSDLDDLLDELHVIGTEDDTGSKPKSRRTSGHSSSFSDLLDELGTVDTDTVRVACEDTCALSDPSPPSPHKTRAPVVHPSEDGRGQHTNGAVECCSVTLEFLSNWGDPLYLGLSGLELLDDVNEVIPVEVAWVHAQPASINDLPGVDGDDRTIDKLLDGINTTDDHHMWMIPFDHSLQARHLLSITLPSSRKLGGLRVWNYNRNAENACRGARSVRVYCDGALSSAVDGVVFRKGPAFNEFDHSQFIPLVPPTSGCNPRRKDATPAAEGKENTRTGKESTETMSRRGGAGACYQGFETPHHPEGFILKMMLHSTWGDMHYIGLDGIELYDERNEVISIAPGMYHAAPWSINDLSESSEDIRTPDKLFNGQNNSLDDRNMWLAPFELGKPNLLVIIFNEPTTISMIKFWNYTKTLQRGVDEIDIMLDDLIIFQGSLRKAPVRRQNSAPHCAQTILFTRDSAVVAREKTTISFSGRTTQAVQFSNDGRICIHSNAPKTAVNLKHQRPATRSGTSARNIVRKAKRKPSHKNG